MTREERKQKMRQAVQSRQEEQNSNGNGYEEIAYVPLKKNQQTVVRMLGLPANIREQGSDVAMLQMAMIKDDEGKFFRAIYPNGDRDYILRRVYNTVCDYTWDEENNAPNYKHSDLDVFKKVRYNDAPRQNRKYATGWRPSMTYLANVLDRSDMQWHKENKHTKVIAKKMNVKDDATYYTPGMPKTVYDLIQDDIQRYEDNIDWEEYDIVIEKLADQPWYKVYHGEKDSHRLNPEASDLIVVGDVTDEEWNYERYDFDKLFPVTSYRKIVNRLRMTLKDVDEYFNTRYLEEAEDMASKESKENAASRHTPTSSSSESDSNGSGATESVAKESDTEKAEDTGSFEEETKAPSNGGDNVDESASSTEASPRRRRRAKKEDSSSDGVDFAKVESLFPGVKHLTDDMKSMIVGIEGEQGSERLVFDTQDDLIPCPDCEMESPESFSHCPYCGVEFET